MHMIKEPGAEGHIMGSGTLRGEDGGWHSGLEDLVTKVARGMEALGCMWEGAPFPGTPSQLVPSQLVPVQDALGIKCSRILLTSLRTRGWEGDLYTTLPKQGKEETPPPHKRVCVRSKSSRSDDLEAPLVTGPRCSLRFGVS